MADRPAAPATTEPATGLAHVPVNAINQARNAVDKREAGGQGREAVGAITAGDGSKPLPIRPTPKAAPVTVAGSSSIAPGVSATNADVAAESEATSAFRSFVANAKISGVFQGNPPRVMLNNRLARAGEAVDAALGITFERLDPEKKLLIFRDKSGAVVTRRY